MIFRRQPPAPVHVRGMHKGEELVLHKGKEQGRGAGARGYRSARDSTSIEPDRREPIDPANKVIAMYPSPGGATESLLPLANWAALAENNPPLRLMEPDVEALLVNRVGEARDYLIAPIDQCYELVGLIRTHWRGFSGGDVVWQEIAAFFTRLKERSEVIGTKKLEAANA